MFPLSAYLGLDCALYQQFGTKHWMLRLCCTTHDGHVMTDVQCQCFHFHLDDDDEFLHILEDVTASCPHPDGYGYSDMVFVPIHILHLEFESAQVIPKLVKLLSKWFKQWQLDRHVRILAVGMAQDLMNGQNNTNITNHSVQQIKGNINEDDDENIHYLSFPLISKIESFMEQWINSLWLDSDCLPCLFSLNPYLTMDERADSAVRKTVQLFGPTMTVPRIAIGLYNRVLVDANHIHLTSLRKKLSICSEETVENLLRLVTEWRAEQRIAFFSSTPQGGGVALMRHALVRLARQFGIPLQWFVVRPAPNVFAITKGKLHNVLQGVSQSSRLSTNDIHLYLRWLNHNAERYWKQNIFPQTEIMIFDDPQTVALIPIARQTHPSAILLYRSHIQLRSDLIQNEYLIDPQYDNILLLPDDKNISPQTVAWHFLWHAGIKYADKLIFHPIPSMIPGHIPKDKILFMPACTDLWDGLNKPISLQTRDFYYKWFARLCLDQGSPVLNHEKRCYLIQIARFDPSKGLLDMLLMYKYLRWVLMQDSFETTMHRIPQLVMCGHSAVDDPDGNAVYLQVKQTIENDAELKALQDDIIVARLPPSDSLLNVLVSGAHVGLQLSHCEGFEIKVTEMLTKGIPVVVYDTGGLPLQVQSNINGFVISPTGAYKSAARAVYRLVMDDVLHRKMGKAAKETNVEMYTTPFQLTNWLAVSQRLSSDVNKMIGNMALIHDLWKNVRKTDTLVISKQQKLNMQINEMHLKG